MSYRDIDIGAGRINPRKLGDLLAFGRAHRELASALAGWFCAVAIFFLVVCAVLDKSPRETAAWMVAEVRSIK